MNQRIATWRAAIDAGAISTSRLCLLVYLVALAALLSFGHAHGFRPRPRLLDADESEYWGMAGDILSGNLIITARRTLGFPLLLAGLRAIRDDILFVQISVAALNALTAPLLFALVRRLGESRTAALVAGLALALWPPAVFFGASLYSETAAAPIFVGALALMPRPHGRSWLRSMLGTGALLGLATHVRPMYLLFLPCLALVLLVEERSPGRAARAFLVALAGFLVVILPWSAMLTARFHHPVLVTANGGETLAGGLNPRLLHPAARTTPLTPSGRPAWAGPGKWVPVESTGYLSPAELGLPYDARDRLLRARSEAWIFGHPADVAYLEACKLGYMWGFYGLSRNSHAQLLFGNVPILILLAFMLWCVAAGPPGRFGLARLWILPLFVSGVALISWGSWRFRQPGDIGLIGFAAICLVYLIGRGRTCPAESAGSAR